jgi:hypothetical protein
MRRSITQIQDLANRLFAAEALRHGQGQPIGASETMERVCQRLQQRLKLLIGAGGLYALFARALYLAKVEHPWLDMVEMEQDSDCCLKGLREAAEQQDSDEAIKGFAAITANIIWLLVTFIGEDIILGLMYEAWPEVRNDVSAYVAEHGDEQ